jgi:plasmid maintenance system antidote protein VapI
MLYLRDAEAFRASIEKAGSSNRKLGLAVGISAGRISQLITGHSPAIAAPLAVAIAAELGASVSELFYFPDAEALVRLGLVRAA